MKGLLKLTSPKGLRLYFFPVDRSVNTSFSMSTSTSLPVVRASQRRSSVSAGYNSPLQKKQKKIKKY